MKRPWHAIDPVEYTDFGSTRLSRWNAEKAAEYKMIRRQFSNPEEFGNGLICECGGDLYDTNQQETGHPVRLWTKCKSCGKKELRYE